MSQSATEQVIVAGFDRMPTESDIDEIAAEGGMRDATSCRKIQADIPPQLRAMILECFETTPGTFPQAAISQFRAHAMKLWLQHDFEIASADRIAVMSFQSSDRALFAVMAHVALQN